MALLRNVATVGFYTMTSRVFGFLRDMLTAAALGAGPVSDAFVVAQRLPNLFRSLFAEGAFNVAFVPSFTAIIAEHGEEKAREFAERALALLLSALLLMLVLAELFMPYVMPVIAAGFGHEAGEFDEATRLTRITFPYLLFISLVTLQGGVLNSLNRYAAVAFTPVLLNLFMIAAVIASWWFGHAAQSLCWAITAAGLAQFLWLLSSCARAGMALRLPWPRLGPDMIRFLALMAPGVFGAGVTQLNLLVSTNVASLLPRGSITYLFYAERLNQLPFAVIGIAVQTAIVPPLSRFVREGNLAAANETQNRGMELAFLLTLPAAVALAAIAEPLLSVLFQRGHFDAHAVHATAQALAVYAFGLPAFVAVRVQVPALYARHDMRTPVMIAGIAFLVNVVLTLTLSVLFAHVGNATATTTAGWVNALCLALVLQRRGFFTVDDRLRRRLPRILAASLAMGVVLILAEHGLDRFLHHHALVVRVAALTLLVGSGLASFAVAALGLGAGDWRDLRRLAPRRAR